MKTITLVVFWSCTCWAQALHPILTGDMITGFVKGQDGTPVAGAHVNLGRLPPYPARWRGPAAWSQTTNPDGSFQFQNVLPGSYTLCAQAPNTSWLNSCVWGRHAATTSVSATEPAAVTLILNRGVDLPIRVDDPSNVLAQNEGKKAGAHLLIGVPSDTFVFQKAEIASTDASGRNYHVVVPYDLSLNMVVNGSAFKLNNAAGVAVPQGLTTAIPITAPSGQQPTVIRLVVTGIGN